MKLHYSQTNTVLIAFSFVLLPYEITLTERRAQRQNVLLPYEITLFSNNMDETFKNRRVLLPYEITLFSNCHSCIPKCISVLLPYEITLFSNLTKEVISFTTL